MRANRIVRAHEAIWAEFHEPAGDTLAESKACWLNLLRGDPTMADRLNWADLAGTVTPTERAEFEAWLIGTETLRSSEAWSQIVDVTVMDPDGWDRRNFAESWAEMITEDEFRRRLAISTILRGPSYSRGRKARS